MSMDIGAINEVMAYKIMYDQFANQVQVVMNLYAKYDPHTLALFGDMPPEKRWRLLNNIKVAYVKVTLEILTLKNLTARNEVRITLYTDANDKVNAQKWRNVNQGPTEWLQENESLLDQAQSQYAMCRSIALVQAFETKKKGNAVLGTTKDIIASVKKSAGLFKKQQKEGKVAMSEEDRQTATDAGLDPDKVFEQKGD